jgi:hypothetical protein
MLRHACGYALANKGMDTRRLQHYLGHASITNTVRERELAFDPALSPDLSKARQAMEDSAFLVGRLQTLRPRLERKLAAVLAAERHARWLSDYQQVKAKRDQAVEAFQHYPELVVQLLTILHTARSVDAECDRINGSAPSGEPRRLLGVELTARGLKEFSTAWPSIAASVTPPDIQNPGRTLWPPPKQIDPALLAPVVPYDPHFSPHWGEVKEQEERAAREQAEREREQFEADAVERQRRSGGLVWWPHANGQDRAG